MTPTFAHAQADLPDASQGKAAGMVVSMKTQAAHKRDAGDEASQQVTITDDMVKTYARLVGDENPIHIDPETGRKSIFGTNIAHGMLVGSLFGPVIVNQLIGPGCIYRKQLLEFDAPVPIGEQVTATVTVVEAKHKPDKSVYVLRTECFRADGVRVITGDAVIIAPLAGLEKSPDDDAAKHAAAAS